MANNSLTTVFNTSPYYDDFDEDKNFHRVLFKPALAVQARELTQLQSIIQKQIDRFGEHIFKEGSFVSGGKTNLDQRYNYIKIEDNNNAGNAITLSELVGLTLTSVDTQVSAIVVNFAEGNEASFPNTKTLFIKYTSASRVDNETSKFAKGETLVTNNGITFKIYNDDSAVGIGTALTITENILFAKDHFIKVPEQTIIISKYSNNPTARVGYRVIEDIITSNDDFSLLDPARGSTNYAAPGADRLKLTCELVLFDVAYEDSFIDILRIENGIIQSFVTKPEYSIIRDEMARRTFEESGNYTVNGLGINIRENLNNGVNYGVLTANQGGNSSMLAVGVEPGKAYVFGYEVEKLVTEYLNVEKGNDFIDVEQQTVSANYGNYVLVTQVSGVLNLDTPTRINLRNTAINASSGNVTDATVLGGSVIGSALAKSLELHSGVMGAPTAIYRLYLTDLKITSGNINDVRSFNLVNPINADFFADVSGLFNFNESTFDMGVYPIAASNLRRIRDDSGDVDTTFTFKKTFNISVGTNGNFSINSNSNEIFPFSLGSLNATQKRNNFLVVTNNSFTVAGAGTVTVTSGGAGVTGSGTTFTNLFVPGSRIQIGSRQYIISAVNTNTSMSLTTNALETATASAYSRAYNVGDILDFAAKANNGTERSISLTSSSSAVFNLNDTLSNTITATVTTNLNKIDAREAKKVIRRSRYVKIRPSTNAGGLLGPWSLGFTDVIGIRSIRMSTGTFATATEGTDVTNSFDFDYGQKDTIYDHARISKRPNLTITASHTLLVELDYFYHDTSQGVGYFSVDSYPVNDSVISSTTILTQEIPTYTSRKTGETFNLRDCIDTRPWKTQTAADATVVGNATLNPAYTESYEVINGGSRIPSPNENFVMDLSYYLPRKDLVTLNKDGKLNIVRGNSSLSPITPDDRPDTMTLAVLSIAPYPSLPYNVALAYKRVEYANSARNVAIKRWTMRDIGVLAQRTTNLEYYTALNLLEKNTLDIKILDENGLDRFKNGIITDPFRDHSVGDTANSDYAVAVDRQRAELRPKFILDNFENKLFRNDSLVQSGNLLTLPYQHEIYINQNVASTTRNAAGLFYSYKGELFLTPEVDNWVSTDTLPNIQISQDLGLSNWQNIADAWGTEWGDWQTRWTSSSSSSSTSTSSSTVNVGNATTGVNAVTTRTSTTSTTTTTRTGQERQGFYFDVSSETLVQDYGDRVIDVSVVPYMRSILIFAKGIGLKPNTKLYAFFDGENVDPYITQSTESGVPTKAAGVNVVTSETGTFFANFVIPNDDKLRFTVGTKKLRFTDTFDNNDDYGSTTTSCEANFSSSGLKQTKQGTIVSTVVPHLNRINVSENRTLTSSSTSVRSSSSTSSTVISPPAPPPVVNPPPPVVVTPPVVPPTVPWTPPVVPPPPPPPVVPPPPPPPIRVVDPIPVRVRRDPDALDFSALSEGGGDGADGDPIAQTFTVTTNGEAAGMFLTAVSLFFAEKHPTLGTFIEIRELDSSGYLTQKVIPYSRKYLRSSDIVTSTDSTGKTIVAFDAPIFVLDNTDYALVVKPEGTNDKTILWVARLGDADIVTGNKITQQPYSGVVFASANDRVYEPIQNEDFKFELYRAGFISGTGYVQFTNGDIDYLRVNTLTGDFASNETIRGNTTITVSNISGSGSIAVGDRILGSASGTSGTVLSVAPLGDDFNVTLTDLTAGRSYTTGESITVRNSSNVAKDIIASISNQQVSFGFVDKIAVSSDGTYYDVIIRNRFGPKFAVGEKIQGSINGGTFNLVSIEDKIYNLLNPQASQIVVDGTNINWSLRNYNTSKNVVNYGSFEINNDVELNYEALLVSYSNEVNPMVNKSVVYDAEFKTNSTYVSPVIDLTRIHSIFVKNIINNDATGEEEKNGGNAVARYITRKVTLAEDQDAEDMLIYLSAYRPASTDIKIYVKFLNAEDSDNFDDVKWKELTFASKSLYSDSQNKNDYKEFKFAIPTTSLIGPNGEYQYVNSAGVTFRTYKYFAIKIVLLGENSSLIPKGKDLRVIALQR